MVANQWSDLFKSINTSDRLKAVRKMAREADSNQLDTLLELRRSESDSWVQRAMDQLIRNWRGEQFVRNILGEPIDSEIIEAKAGEIQTLTRQFVHEVGHLCGRIEARAMLEIEHYEDSKTRAAVVRLQDFLQVLKDLHEAAEPVRIAEFNLSDCIRGAAELCDPEVDEIVFAREDSVTIEGDERHLRLALMNVIRNAIDESRLSGEKVTIAWGASDRSYWVSVQDGGRGLPPGFSRMFEPSVTTKSAELHFGWGLTIAKQALDVLGATIKYTPAANGGALCLISREGRAAQ